MGRVSYLSARMKNSFGILQTCGLNEPPGTSRLQADQEDCLPLDQCYKTGNGRHKNTILVPQPSDHADDPLNWSLLEKRTVLWSVALASALVHSIGPSFSTSCNAIAQDFHQSLDRVVQVVSGNYSLTAGLGAILVTAFSICYGKRLTFVLSTLCLAPISAWLVLEERFSTFAVARALQGFASAPLEVLATGLVSDLFFIHERGTALSIIGFLMTAFTLLSQIAGGFVVEYLGWRKLFLGQSILMAIVSLLLFCFVAETNWSRNSDVLLETKPRVTKTAYNMQELRAICELPDLADTPVVTSTQDGTCNSQTSKGGPSTCGLTPRIESPSTQHTSLQGSRCDVLPYARRANYMHRLTLFNGRAAQNSFWATSIRPLLLLCHPAVQFGIFVHGLGSTWLHAFGFAKLALFSRAPYNLSPSQIGLTVIPAAISGALAQIVAGYLFDDFIKVMARRNKGIYEAEFRLVLMIPQAIASLVGFLGFGISIEQGRPLWLVLFFYACVTFSIPFGSLASLSYLVDSLPRRNQEALVSTIFVKSIFILVFASLINGWLKTYGPQNVFVCLGLVNLGISCCTIPFYIFGKRLRSAIAKSPILNRLDQSFCPKENKAQHTQL